MNRLEYLLRSSQVTIRRFDHQPDAVHADPEEEVCQDYAIHFVEAGSFQLSTGGKHWTLSPGSVFISRPAAVHRYTHPQSVPSDVCLSVVYARQFVEEVGHEDGLLPPGVPTALPATNRLAYLKLRLAGLPRGADAFALETWACELMTAVATGDPGKGRLYCARQLRWYAERVEATCEMLDHHYAEPHSLASLAAEVGMSPFQFARVFRELKGLPPHQYLLKVRLDRAYKLIREGQSVTETCFDVGFLNLSHFTRSFRRRFGHPPSTLKPARITRTKKPQESASHGA
ncbi:MAG TPA: AraC family transcriptional regulator [Blastocatellia bacterium]|nr:AraC family transcriptional regulator [Blastocatellia bacterium]